MKILLDKEYEIKLSADAVEKIEEHYDKSLEEIFAQAKMRSKDVTFIVWASMQEEITLEEAKKQFSKYYNYTELVNIMTKILNGDEKNAQSVTENA